MNISKLFFLLSLRTLAFGSAYLLTVFIFLLSGSDNILIQASPWWPVYGLVANLISCLVLKREFRKEEIKCLDPIHYDARKIKKDLLHGAILILLSILVATSSSIGFGFLFYGRFPNELMLSFDSIPDILMVLLLVVFPVINSISEEITYNGYIFPRLESKTKSVVLTVMIVLFFFTIQHLFITFRPDFKYLVWRLLSFIPLLLLWILVYVRMRRLTTLILTHWFMDLYAMLSIIYGAE